MGKRAARVLTVIIIIFGMLLGVVAGGCLRFSAPERGLFSSRDGAGLTLPDPGKKPAAVPEKQAKNDTPAATEAGVNPTKTASPEAAIPETVGPEAAIPEKVGPEAAIPEKVSPETDNRKTANPETTIQEKTNPETAIPENKNTRTSGGETAASETAGPKAASQAAGTRPADVNTVNNSAAANNKPRPGRYNRDLNTINTLFLGLSGGKPVMVSICCIDPPTGDSAVVFFSPDLVVGSDDGQTIAEVLRRFGPKRLQKLLAARLQADLPYYVVFDQEGMEKLAELLGPVRVRGREIHLGNLYLLPDTPDDEAILAEVARKFHDPGIIWKIPALIRVIVQHTSSNFGFRDLWQLYPQVKKLEPAKIRKVILQSTPTDSGNKKARTMSPRVWQTALAEALDR